MTTPITIRQSTETDAPMLHRLAELDSARLGLGQPGTRSLMAIVADS